MYAEMISQGLIAFGFALGGFLLLGMLFDPGKR
jgi:hypothetical protein